MHTCSELPCHCHLPRLLSQAVHPDILHLCCDNLLAAMSQVDVAATDQQAAIQGLNARKKEQSEAEEIWRAAKNALSNASLEEKAKCEREVDKAEDEVARLRWEVAKAEKKVAVATGQSGDWDNLQSDVDVYRDAYRKRISGQQAVLILLMYVCMHDSLVCTFLLSMSTKDKNV